MPEPGKVISTALAEFITAHGPIIMDDVPAVAKKIVEAVRKAWDCEEKERPTKAKPKPPRRPAVRTSDADDAIGQCERIIGMCDEMPERGEEFADSVREKTESIQAWIEENDHVTEAQQEALDNMESGLSRWLDR